jgi:hypothetical protein
MIKTAERVSNVVQQGAGHVLVVTASLHGERRSEQRVMQAVDRESAKVAVEKLEMRHDALRKLLRIFHEVGRDERPIFAGGIFDAGERGRLLVRHVGQFTQIGAGSTRLE